MSKVQTIQPHVDNASFLSALRIKDKRTMINVLSGLAHSGNIYAANLFGDLLLLSVWDEEKMGFDICRGMLIPPTEDPKNDPYLILGRDVKQAIYLYELACSNPDSFCSCPAFISAKSKLDYCLRKGLAGFQANKSLPKSEIGVNSRVLLDRYAKNMGNEASGEFVAVPDVRPKPVNPRNEMFKHFARVQRDRCVYQIIFILLIFGFLKVKNGDYFQINYVLLSAFIIPLTGCFLIYKKFGLEQKLPMCSCNEMRRAFFNQDDKMPFECKSPTDPFATSNFFIRNFGTLKKIWFWLLCVYSIAALVAMINGYDLIGFTDKPKIEYIFDICIAILLSTFLLAWEKKLPEFCTNLGQAQLVVMVLAGVFFFFFEDNDCSNEIDRINEKTSPFQEIIDYELNLLNDPNFSQF